MKLPALITARSPNHMWQCRRLFTCTFVAVFMTLHVGHRILVLQPASLETVGSCWPPLVALHTETLPAALQEPRPQARTADLVEHAGGVPAGHAGRGLAE